MSYRSSKLSVQTDVTSASLPIPQFPAHEVGARCDSRPGGNERTDSSCDGLWPTLLQVSIHTFAGRDSQKHSIFYFLRLSNTKDKLDPMLEEIEVSSDTRSSAWSQQAPNHARGFQS